MAEITDKPINPQHIINDVKTTGSGCVATYVGLIRDYSRDKRVVSVEYQDTDGTAKHKLQQIEDEINQKWLVNNLSIVHRIGKLLVGDINLVIAIAAAHRQEGFAACQYAVDRFKDLMPAHKIETYLDGSIWEQEYSD